MPEPQPAPGAEVREAKAALRTLARARRAALDDRAQRSAAITARVVALDAFQQARVVHTYLSIGAEVATYPLAAAILAAGKGLIVPVVTRDKRVIHSWLDQLDPDAFDPGPLGTVIPKQLRPAQPTDWQLILVPLLAFDRRGYRLGYGKGHYDGILQAPHSLAVGLAFACQACERVPTEPHDQPLDLIITESEVMTCYPNSH